MADHADQHRSALTEFPLWLWWRVMTLLAPLYRLAVGWLEPDPGEGPLNRRLAVATALLAVVAFALAVLVVALLV